MAFYDTPGLFYDSGVQYDAVAPPPERKRMAKVKVGFKNPSREQIADKIDTVKTAMTGNASFTTPNPTLTVLGAAGTTNVLSQSISNPPTQAQVQAIQNKLNELINAITRPVA